MNTATAYQRVMGRQNAKATIGFENLNLLASRSKSIEAAELKDFRKAFEGDGWKVVQDKFQELHFNVMKKLLGQD
jgi:hypothetical protein